MAPLNSPELVRATPRRDPARPPALLPWSVPGLRIDPAELAAPSPDVRYGATVVHLHEVSELGPGSQARA